MEILLRNIFNNIKKSFIFLSFETFNESIDRLKVEQIFFLKSTSSLFLDEILIAVFNTDGRKHALVATNGSVLLFCKRKN